MTTLLATIIVLGVLVTIHEYGHFIAARSVGIRVDKFSVGMPPRFLTITSCDDALLLKLFFFKKDANRKLIWAPVFQTSIVKPGRVGSKTEYVVALLPLGGYVKMAGIIDESMDTKINHKDDEFMSKPLWAKLWVMSAGVIMNTILAFVIFSSIGYYQGTATISDEPVIAEIIEEMPAEKAGLVVGDRVLKINDNEVYTWSDLTKSIHQKPNEEIKLKIDRYGEILNFNIITTIREIPNKNGTSNVGAIGIIPQITYDEMTLFQALNSGIARTLGSFGMIVESLKMLGSGAASVSDFGGPIMIAQLAGKTAEAGMIPFFTFMALLSVNLAFLNILPIPGLDGGHIFIHLLEGIINRPLPLKARITIQQLGMTFLLILMVTIIFQDITRLFN